MGSISETKIACYNAGGQTMSMIGEGIYWNSTSTFLGFETKPNFQRFGEIGYYINSHASLHDKASKGLDISAFLPHLLLVIVLVVLVSRVLHYLFRHVKQPLIVCQVIAGILVFSVIHKNSSDNLDTESIHSRSMLIAPANRRLEDVMGFVGVVVNLFVIGVKMDHTLIWRTGMRKPLIIGLSSLFIPLIVTFSTSSLLFDHLELFFKKKNSPFIIFMVYTLCSSYFAVMADILEELGLLNSELGRLALSCSMVQCMVGWIFGISFAVVFQGQHNWLMGLAFLVSFLVLIAFIFFVVRPYALWIVRTTPSDDRVSNVHVFVIVLVVFVAALGSDLLGTICSDGPVILGLTLPKGTPLATALIERVDMVASELLLPIVFMKEGYMIDWSDVKQNLAIWFWIEFIVLVAFVIRIVVTMAACMYCGMPAKNGLLLGLILNFRGLIEMLTYLRFANFQLIDKTIFTMLLLSTISITIVCTPLVSIYYKPLSKGKMGRLTVQSLWSHAELRVMACFYDDKPIPALLDFLESASPQDGSICIYTLHLVGLKGCVSSSLTSHRDNKGVIDMEEMDPIHNHFLTFQKIKKDAVVLPFTSVAPLKTMHQDICTLILERNIAFVIVPFPKVNSMADLETNAATRDLVPLVLKEAPCSVGILVYHNTTRITMPTHWKYRVGVLFWGGSDDREAISIACHIARHPEVYLHVMRFHESTETNNNHNQIDNDDELAYDDMLISNLQAHNSGNARVGVSKIGVDDLENLLVVIRNLSYRKYDLLIVGNKQTNSSMLEEVSDWVEFPELGVVGDMLAADLSGNANVLIVQQHGSSC